jgi:predicted Zn finger-like uncharacterized protein
MLIVCPSCQTSYDVSAASLGEAGRSVRCVRCQEVWFATPAAAEASVMANAAAASAQYQRRAETSGNTPGSDPAGGDASPDDDPETVDPNLAARAAGLSNVAFGDPLISVGAVATGMVETESLAVYDAPPLAPEDDAPAPGPVGAVAEPAEDIETVAARRARRETTGRARGGWRPSAAMLIMLLLPLNAALLGWRSDVVRLMPQTASLFAAIGLPVNLRGLAFTDVKTTKEVHDGVPVLLVQGTIANVSRQPHDVARLRFAMRNSAGREIYTWTTLPARSVLAPGDSEPFQTRLASPPAEGREVVVRFFNRRDTIAGIR